MTFEVLEQKWLKFEASISKSQNFDEIIRNHHIYLDECLKESLLLDSNLVKTLSKINISCLIYAKSIQSFTQIMKVDDNYAVRVYPNISKLILNIKSMTKKICLTSRKRRMKVH